MGRWSKHKNKDNTGIKNYFNPGDYLLSLKLIKYVEEEGRQGKWFAVIEATVKEVLFNKTCQMRGKNEQTPREVTSQTVGETASFAWNFGTAPYPDSLMGEFMNACGAILGMTDAERKEADDDEWDEAMDSLVEENGEEYVETLFIARVGRHTAREGGHNYTKAVFEPYNA